MLGEDNTLSVLNKMMELTTRKHQVIANNVANSNTPGYIRRDIDFANEMSRIIKSQDWQSLSSFDGTVKLDESRVPKNDGNNISITEELNEMSQNGVLHELVKKAFQTKVGLIKKAIK